MIKWKKFHISFFAKSRRVGAGKNNFQNSSNPKYHGVQELLNNEVALKNYNFHTIKLLTAALKEVNHESRILEFGAGTGTLSLIFQEKYRANIKCVEIDEILVEQLKKRGFETYPSVQESNSRYTGIFSSNVLEHIEDDAKYLKILNDFLEPGGHLAIYVPAFPILFSDLDRNVGHVRRYRKQELVKKIEDAGMIVDYCNYADSIGFIASFAIKVFGFNTKSGLGSVPALRIYDRLIFPFSLLLDSIGLRKIIGKNLIVSARKH